MFVKCVLEIIRSISSGTMAVCHRDEGSISEYKSNLVQ